MFPHTCAKKKVTGLLIIGTVFALAACAGSGLSFREYERSLPPLPINKARLVVFRTEDYQQHRSTPATVSIDGKSAGRCAYAGFVVFDIPAGKHVLTAGMPGSRFHCDLDANIAGGGISFFEIRPGDRNPVSELIDAIRMLSGKQAAACRGAFSISPVEEESALRQLEDLEITASSPPDR